MRRVLIYTHSGPHVGMGHAVRCSHLARALVVAGAEVTIASSPAEPGWPILSEVDGTASASAWSAPEAVRYVRPGDVAVVDLMEAQADILRMLKNGGARTVTMVGAGWSITDEVKAQTNLLVYQTGFPVDGGDLSGPDYLVLSPQYALREETQRTNDVLVSFGGAIPLRYSVEVAQACSAFGMKGTLAFGPGYAREVVGSISNFDIAWWPPSLYPYQAKTKVHIGSMGMTTYEDMAAGCAPVMVSRDPDHLGTAQRLWREGWLSSLGLVAETRPQWLADAAQHIMEIAPAIGLNGRALVDGKGAAKVAQRIMEL